MTTRIQSYLIVLTLIMAGISATAQGTLDVTVQNIKEKKGSIRVGLFTNEKDFLKKAAEGKVIKASDEEVKVSFQDLKPGVYALSVIHDENENGELDSNFMGIPKEGFCFGNNAMGTFGPPSFEEAKVVIEKTPVKQVVKLKYY